MPAPEIAYLSGGKIHVRAADGNVRTFISKFGAEVRDRALRIEQRNAWKEDGRGAMFQRGGMPGAPAAGAVDDRVDLTSLAVQSGGEQLLYALDTSSVTGVLELDLASGDERRLFHSNHTRVCDLAPAPEGERIACALRLDNGLENLAMINREGGGLEELTEGDSVDSAPRWSQAAASELVYQSAGIARDDQGVAVGQGPSAVHRLQLETGDIETLLEDAAHDFLVPQVAADGSLYCIRRPYEDDSFAPRPVDVLKGILLFPFHLFMVAFNVVDHLTQLFGRKPLMRAGGGDPKVDQRLVVLGRAIELGDVAKGKRRKGRSEVDLDAPLVPGQWELIRRTPGQEPVVVAKHVLAFDLSGDGGVVYTTGSVLYHVDAAGTASKLGRVERALGLVSLG